MQNVPEEKHNYGLIGRNISYSFSRNYFTNKFNALHLNDHSYQNFDLQDIEEFPEVLKNTFNLKGLNVTIPYKESVIEFLDELDDEACEIGAVNTIKILEGNRLRGFNTDAYGFESSLKPLLKEHHKKALILGTGGASKAINHVFNKLDITALFVSRHPEKEHQISYKELSESILKDYSVIVNCTPLGTHPDIEKFPDIPYEYLTPKHLVYDLIYNPPQTAFLTKAKEKGSRICNGLKMLELQAERAWEIWNS